MKINRMLCILTLLLQHDKVTAPQLAERLEVSKRTIHRDIDAICSAGIPIVTYQGGNGGIAIADGFKLDKSLLTLEELQSILTGLKGLHGISETSRIEKLIDKLTPGNEALISMRDSVVIDLTSHYKGSLQDKITKLKRAINERRVIEFIYFSDKGRNRRMVEPVFISFKWSAWYLFGFCREKKDFRLFKLNRLWDLNMLEETFIQRDIPPDRLELDSYFKDENKLTLLLDKSLEYLVIDEYGPNSYEMIDNQTIRMTVPYTNKEYIISWILGFGEKARVVEPPEMVLEMKKRAKKLLCLYEHDI